MEEAIKIVIGVGVLILGFVIGNLLAQLTKEELKSGQKWFRIIVTFCFIGAIVSLILGRDVLLFSFLFIAIVTSRSLKHRGKGL